MSKKYHHNDLRAALINEGLKALDTQGYDKLSLRELAGAANVSRAAPYHHFANREEFLRALIDEGFIKLEQVFSSAAAQPGSAMQRLRAAACGYLNLAASRPGLFHLMFDRPLSPKDLERRRATAEPPRSFVIFHDLVADAIVPTERNPDRTRTAAIAAWAAIHGLTVLRRTRMLSALCADDADEERLVAATLDALFLSGAKKPD